MTDISAQSGYSRLSIWQALCVSLLILLSCSAIREMSTKDRCETTLGRLAVALDLDQYYSGCRCMKPWLNFGDTCNSFYVPLL